MNDNHEYIYIFAEDGHRINPPIFASQGFTIHSVPLQVNLWLAKMQPPPPPTVHSSSTLTFTGTEA